MQNIRSVRGVRKEINYSEPCSNAADKAQLSLGCTHLNTRWLRSLMLKWVQVTTTQTQLCFILGIWAQFGIIYFLNNIFLYIVLNHIKFRIDSKKLNKSDFWPIHNSFL